MEVEQLPFGAKIIGKIENGYGVEKQSNGKSGMPFDTENKRRSRKKSAIHPIYIYIYIVKDE